MVLGKLKDSINKRKDNGLRHIVALDVGTEYVKALIGQLDGEDMTIIGVGRQRQNLSDMHSGAISDIAGVVSNCDKALSQAEEQAGISVRQTVIGIAGELVKGTTSTIRYKRPKPEQEIDLAEMEHIIDKVQERAYEQARKQLNWELGNKDIDIKLVNSAIVSIEIDSYKVSNPIGFQGKDVAIQLYTAFAPMIHIGALERTATELDLDLLAVAAEPFAVARSVVGYDASSSLSAILIDVGGGTTDIAVLNDGGVEGTKMFGIGGRAFTRTIAADMDLDFGVAEALKMKLGAPNLKPAQKQQAMQAVNKTLEVWLHGVELALSEFNDIDHLPHQILLCGGGASLEPLVDALKTRSWYGELPFTRKPTVHHIEPEQVVGIGDATGKVTDHTLITAMGLLRVGHDTISGSDGPDGSVKEKLNKLLRI